jgi:hypothetical protein|tara:strand:+ start:2567 stop:3703 length:1137 start_codon:yes stop_codon:yes gene_type:complete
MEIKVKDLGAVKEKSRAEIEEQLLQKHEEKFEDTAKPTETVEKVEVEKEIPATEEPVAVEKENTPVPELNDTDVLSYIKDRYNKDINSVDELFAEKEANEELPEDVSAYFKYKKETGRGIADFYNLQKDYSNMDEDDVLANYYSATEEGLDAIDIQDIIVDKFSVDEDVDDPKDVKRIRLAKKRELAKAKKFLNEQKDKYKIPLESSGDGLSAEQQENLNAYKSYIEESQTVEEKQKKRYDYFLNKTGEVFNNEFKGFDFKVGENNITYKPGTSDELKNVQSDINNFVGKFMDKEGLISDAQGYHRSMAVAMNPEKFAQFFYDQGVTNAVDNVSRKSKNINMDMRQAPQTVSKDGMKIRPVGNTDSGRGLKIRSIKRS